MKSKKILIFLAVVIAGAETLGSPYKHTASDEFGREYARQETRRKLLNRADRRRARREALETRARLEALVAQEAALVAQDRRAVAEARAEFAAAVAAADPARVIVDPDPLVCMGRMIDMLIESTVEGSSTITLSHDQGIVFFALARGANFENRDLTEILQDLRVSGSVDFLVERGIERIMIEE